MIALLILLLMLFTPTVLAHQECRQDGPRCLPTPERIVCADLGYFDCNDYDGCNWESSNPFSVSGVCEGTRPACETFSDNHGLCESYQGCQYYPSCDSFQTSIGDCAPAPSCIPTQDRKVCAHISYALCNGYDGCNWVGSNPLTPWRGYCNGTRTACENFSDNEAVCESHEGCNYFEDPPCSTDPFDLAIAPVLVDRETYTDCLNDDVRCALGDPAYCSCVPTMGFGEKERPSVDGLVEFSYFFLFANFVGTFSCSMKVDGQICQSCTPCFDGSVVVAIAFDCRNALVQNLEDNNCPEGTRSVGRGCDSERICDSISNETEPDYNKLVEDCRKEIFEEKNCSCNAKKCINRGIGRCAKQSGLVGKARKKLASRIRRKARKVCRGS